jgi:hypothetical protein
MASEAMGFDAGIIRELVAPAVLIPACGLLCLSTNARMMSVLGRVRTLHHERAEMYVDDPQENPRRKEVRAIRLEGLALQTEHMLRRLNLMRITLILLFSSILTLLICSGFVGLSAWRPGFGAAAVAAFAAGCLGMAAAMALSIIEGRIGRDAVRYEHERILCLGECVDESTRKGLER